MASTLHDPRYRQLIDLLVAARKEAGLTQDGLSARLGRPQSFLGKIETFQRRLDALELFDLLEALGLPPARFAARAESALGPRPRARRRRTSK